jgi:hypothetical protein
MVVHSAPVQGLSSKIYRSMSSLNLRDWGYMLSTLQQCRAGHMDGHTFYIIENGRLQSWSLVFVHNGLTIMHAYTREAVRRQGYAKAILSNVKTMFPNVTAHHDDDNIIRRMGIMNAPCCPWDYNKS